MSDGTTTEAWVLKPILTTGFAGEIPLPRDGLTLGRNDDNGVVVPNDEFPHVSGRHARIAFVAGLPVVEDCGSRNGTLVNGRPVERHELRHGDVVQLGSVGPRFAVLSGQPPQTIAIVAPSIALSRSGLLRVKDSLGIPGATEIDSLIAQRSRRVARSLWVALGVVALLVVAGFAWFGRGSEVDAARLAELQQRLGDAQAALEQQTAARTAERQRLEGEQRELLARLDAVASRSDASADAVQALRTQLETTNKTLALYDPIKVAEHRLAHLDKAVAAVVFLGVSVYTRDRASGKRLHVVQHGGEPQFNTAGRGDEYVVRSSGTGFAVGPDGWIVTNAHVALPHLEAGADGAATRGPFDSEVEIDVVFNGRSDRHRAKLVDYVYRGPEDLALLSIEPFAGMPHLTELDVTAAPPPIGSDLFVCGFPLGENVVHGESLRASVFGGVMSRAIDGDLLQIHAAVHPGSSGGPVIDDNGKVVGVVKGVQNHAHAGAADAYEPTIGYVIPVAAAAKIWPPRR